MKAKHIHKKAVHAIKRHDPEIRFTSGLIALFCLFTMLISLFTKLASEVIERDTLKIDMGLLKSINNHSGRLLDITIPVLTDLGGVLGVTAITVIALILFAYIGKKREAIFVAIAVIGGLILNLTLKLIFARPRPDLWERLVQEAGYSFPSGHSMLSAVAGMAIAYSLWHTKWRNLALILAALYMVFVGFTRLYLGVHYPTDVIGGWLVGGAWIMALALLFKTSFAQHFFEKKIDK